MRKCSILELIQSAFSSLIEFCKFQKGDEMKPQNGYYSIVQYCPELSRFEAANIGVLLFCPDSGFLNVMTSGNNRRIIKFFGSEGHDWKRINTIKKALQDRLDKEHKANPVRFGAEDPEQSFRTACRFAVEGRSIYEHADKTLGDLQLVVVGQFRPKDDVSPTLVRRVFNESHVKLYSSEEIPKLIDEIRRTGKDIVRTKKA